MPNDTISYTHRTNLRFDRHSKMRRYISISRNYADNFTLQAGTQCIVAMQISAQQNYWPSIGWLKKNCRSLTGQLQVICCSIKIDTMASHNHGLNSIAKKVYHNLAGIFISRSKFRNTNKKCNDILITHKSIVVTIMAN